MYGGQSATNEKKDLLIEKKPFQQKLSLNNQTANQKDDKELRLKLYKFLLQKYSDIINDFEKKTVGEIKSLIDTDDLSIQSLSEEFKKQGFDFEKNYLDSAKKAFEFTKKEFSFVNPQISDLNFWLSPKEILQEKIGDDKDLAVFLCTLLACFEDKNAEVIVAELTDGSTHAFVATEYKNKFFILDPSQGHAFEDFSGAKANVLENYSFNGQKIARFIYRFNRQKYEQFF